MAGTPAPAAAAAFERRHDAVRRALDTMPADGESPPAHVVALFDGGAVIERGGALTQYDCAESAGAATLSGPEPFESAFRTVDGTVRESASLVAGEAEGRRGRWLIRAIRAGLSANGNFYPEAVLRDAAPLFDGVRVLVRADEDHLAGRAKDVRNLIGRLVAPAFVDGRDGAPGEVRAELELIEPEGAVAAKLRGAWERGMADLMGFSIVARARARIGRVGDRAVRIAERIERIDSVDLVVEPGAGGALLDLIEAAPATADEERTEDMSQPHETPPAATTPESPSAAAVDARIAEAVRRAESRAAARAEIAASGLPEVARERLAARFADAAEVEEGAAARAIADERAYLARAADAGAVTGLGASGRAAVAEGRDEKVAKMFDALLDPADRSMTSLKEAYVQTTGDVRVSGRLRACDPALMREALASNSLGEVLGDAIARRMIADYRRANVYDVWRRVASTVPLADFRTQHRTRWGGYGDLPAVAEGAAYAALASPTDEEVTYAPSKRGGTEDVTLETVKNDDAGALMRIPVKLSRAAQRTLAKFVLDLDRGQSGDGLRRRHAVPRQPRQSRDGGAGAGLARRGARRHAQADREGLGGPPGHRSAVDPGAAGPRGRGGGPLSPRHRERPRLRAVAVARRAARVVLDGRQRLVSRGGSGRHPVHRGRLPRRARGAGTVRAGQPDGRQPVHARQDFLQDPPRLRRRRPRPPRPVQGGGRLRRPGRCRAPTTWR